MDGMSALQEVMLTTSTAGPAVRPRRKGRALGSSLSMAPKVAAAPKVGIEPRGAALAVVTGACLAGGCTRIHHSNNALIFYCREPLCR